MRSGATRLALGAAAWIAVGAVAAFLFQSEKHITQQRAALRAFDLHARETTDALAEIRAGQQAYVAAGQGDAFWMPKVAALVERVGQTLGTLRQTGSSSEARAALDGAASEVAEFTDVDTRAREYLKSGQLLMAGDVVFTEGGETTASAARQVEMARLAEHLALDASEAARRRQEALAAAGAGVFVGLVVLVLAPLPRLAAAARPGVADSGLGLAPASTAPDDDFRLRDIPLRDGPAPGAATEPAPAAAAAPEPIMTAARAVSPILKRAAELCTDLGRVRDLGELKTLLGRAADVMDASGLIVWVGSAEGADLRPVLAHGYSPATLSRMPAVARSADNAAARAYRLGTAQIVASRPGAASGAIVVPLLSADGCVGALTAEIRGGGESSESVLAIAAILAAQLAGVLQPPASGQQAAASSQ